MSYFSGEKMTGGYGGPDIINSCTISVNKGEIVTILGPNGAGKSTAMRAMLGMLNLRQGIITINEKDISNLSPQDRVKEGISFVPQSRNVFTGLTVEENLEMGAYLRDESFKDTLDEIYGLFPILKEKKNQFAGELSGGQRQQVALGRALMIKPSVLMLDEVAAGVNRTLLKEISNSILRLNKEKGYTFCMIEHDMDFISRMCDPIIVMSEGSVLFQGTSEEVKNNEQVIESYLGRRTEIKKEKN